MADARNPVWFITGCSTGFGREMARLVLERGWCAVATGRGKASVADLEAAVPERALALELDVTQPEQILSAARAAEERFGRVDILVNNAGYGYQATVEEGEESEIRAQFDANVFGLFALTRALLPACESGGLATSSTSPRLPAWSASKAQDTTQPASKHAVEGWSDALLAEVQPLGIHVTCVEPGPFRTDWAGRSLKQTASKISDYSQTAGARLRATREISGKQPGDPVRAAQAIIEIAEQGDPPRHLVLGGIGFEAVTAQLRRRLSEIEALREISLRTDFPEDRTQQPT